MNIVDETYNELKSINNSYTKREVKNCFDEIRTGKEILFRVGRYQFKDAKKNEKMRKDLRRGKIFEFLGICMKARGHKITFFNHSHHGTEWLKLEKD